MSLFESFKNEYPVSKTLRFELIPEHETMDWLEKDGVICSDEQRAEKYKRLKELLDEYYKDYINKALADAELEGLEEYERLYNLKEKSDSDKKAMEEVQKVLRKQIVTFLRSGDKYKILFKKDVVEKELPTFLADEEDIEIARYFKGFSTMCTGFWENRKNIFSEEEKATAIAYRTIHENLPRFINNMRVFQDQIKGTVILRDAGEITGKAGVGSIEEIFTLDYFSRTLSQDGIDAYNNILGGFTKSDKIKVQGINEAVNLYNQQNKNKKIGLLQPLYKQILSDRVSISFISEKFETDEEAIEAVKSVARKIKAQIIDEKDSALDVIKRINDFDHNGIYIKNDTNLTELSRICFNDWNAINTSIYKWYDDEKIGNEKTKEKYDKAKRDFFKKKDSFDLNFLEKATDGNIAGAIEKHVDKVIDEFEKSFYTAQSVFALSYPPEKNLLSDDTTVEKLKDVLDSIKNIETLIKIFNGAGNETDRDEGLYSGINNSTGIFELFDNVYDKVRNYVTRKPYRTEKIKLTFDAPTLLEGWSLSKEPDNKAVILRKNGYYYLGIISKKSNKIFKDIEEAKGDDIYEKMEYLMTKDVTLSIPKCSTQLNPVKSHFSENDTDYVVSSKSYSEPFTITKEEYDLNNVMYDGVKKWQKDYLRKTGDVDGYNDAVRTWINFCARFLETYSTTKNYDFSDIYPLSKYESVDKFYSEVNQHLYKISFKKISSDYVRQLVEDGKLYLFKIYNKDFSTFSKGRPNLHTLYWKALFAEENIKDTKYRLNGQAEIFYRKKSISPQDSVVHPSNQPIKNKNISNGKTESLFGYDIVKDRRYTVDKFQFHVPITMNYKASDRAKINSEMRRAIKKSENMHVIGIDRGERHLLYVTVIDLAGNIKEQFSLNEIINEYNNRRYSTNYHELLDSKEKERAAARQAWKTIENIKELKDGYMSQVVHVITQLMMKYDAIVVMEDLNVGFKRGRQKVEKQVYQKFEKALIDKLNYYVDKNVAPCDTAGLYNALQLTEKFESFKRMGKQNGALFYVPAWNTSKMDPTTGFVNLLYVKYESVEKSRSFIEKIGDIRFVTNDKDEYFAFDIDYRDFTARADGTKTMWTICSYGTRIINQRDRSGHWASKTVILTDEFKKLFAEYGVSITGEMKPEILGVNAAAFYKRLMELIKVMLQIRNSEINGEIDYMSSPVLNRFGKFFNTNDVTDNTYPVNADANGAYNIARKGLWIVEQFKKTPEDKLDEVKIAVTNKEWLQFAQRNW